MFSNSGTHAASASFSGLNSPTPYDAAARFRTLEAEATFGAEVRRARLATRTLRRMEKSSRTASTDVRSTRSALAG